MFNALVKTLIAPTLKAHFLFLLSVENRRKTLRDTEIQLLSFNYDNSEIKL